MKLLLLLLLAVTGTSSFSQDCGCLEEFRFIKNHIEKNHGGFSKKIKSPEEPAYKKFTGDLEKDIINLEEDRYCIVYLKKYILYLQDHHSNITLPGGQPIDEKNSAALDAFLQSPAFRQTEQIPADSLSLVSYLQKSGDPLEGIYRTADGAYTVALIKNKNRYRDYAGIILASATRLWIPGQVKFELKKNNDSTLHYFIYLRNHALSYEEIPFDQIDLQLPGWVKQRGAMAAKSPQTGNELIRFSILDSQTTMLSIRSFSSSRYRLLDSAYKEIIPRIKKYPRLVIDVRNNGGGADFAYTPLMPLLYTDTIYKDVVDIYNTPGNLAAYRRFDSVSVQNGNKPVFSRSISLMEKAKPYTFVPMGSNDRSTSVFPVNSGYPEKIAILYDRGCASSCESLLFDAMYSKKTIFVGENSGGYTGYGNVMNIKTPCGKTLSWTTTVYRDQWKYEFVGIPPRFPVPPAETDWVDYTRRLLNQ